MWIPYIGQKFETDDSAYAFYHQYAGLAGFNIRKSRFNKHRVTGKITSRTFCCTKEGFRIKDKRDHMIKSPRLETRCGCKAKMSIHFDGKSAKYVVFEFTAEHNHPLHEATYAHMIPSQPRMAESPTLEVGLDDDFGNADKALNEQLDRPVKGPQFGYRHLDHKNYLKTKRQRNMLHGEAGSMLSYLQKQTLENPSFFYAVQLDDDEQITNFFWTDAQMVIDYRHFGDAITFNTTYSTDKEYRPLGIFYGINHHREPTIFGAALLYDYTVKSFEWLFHIFLEVHGQKRPKTIFTDQHQAIDIALQTVLPDAYHALCVWHVMRNGVRHLGSLFKNDGTVFSDLKKCMFNYQSESEFESAWTDLIKNYEVSEDSWLNQIYKVKEKWAAPYMLTAFTIGLSNPQICESVISDLSGYLKLDMDIISFCKHFEKVVIYRRYNALQLDIKSQQDPPKLRYKKAPILKQASEVYTPSIFELFQEEFDEHHMASIVHREVNDPIHRYTISVDDGDLRYEVHANVSKNSFSCSCKKFETFGILCSHIIKILENLDIKYIPDNYILKRWTKSGRDGILQVDPCCDIQEDPHFEFSGRYRELCSLFVKISSRAAESKRSYELVYNSAIELSKRLEEMCLVGSCQME